MRMSLGLKINIRMIDQLRLINIPLKMRLKTVLGIMIFYMHSVILVMWVW